VIPHGHSLTALGAYCQTLQQSRTFTRWTFLTFHAECLSVVTQTLNIPLEFTPGNITFVRIVNERSPFLGRKSHEGMATVGMPAGVRAPKAECTSVAWMMQDPQRT
jgi:hypothetical protein